MMATRLHVRKGYWGIATTLATFWVGAWLVLSPYALGYQRYGAPWAVATTDDFWVGLGVMLVSMVGLMLFSFALLGTLREAGYVRPTPRQPPRHGVAPTSPQRDEYERTMALLALELAADLSERRAKEAAASGNKKETGRLSVQPAGNGRPN